MDFKRIRLIYEMFFLNLRFIIEVNVILKFFCKFFVVYFI